MTNAELAVSRLDQGHSCSQAILSVYCERFGLDMTTALRVAAGFGGGFGRTGRTCGAVTGAVMVLGLSTDGAKPTDPQAKSKVADFVQEFLAEFEVRCGATDCRDLLGCEIDTPEKMAAAKAKGLLATVCPKAVRAAADILDEMLAAPPA
jgi:C_GCAxxG_C_C family probable redox protein